MTATAALHDAVMVSGRRVITAADRGAAVAGAAMLAAGGNAFDAVLAACFVETIALPMKCGLAGDLVALVRPAGREAMAIVSVGPAPRALGAGARLAQTGPCSVGIPGAPQGYAALHDLARFDLETLIGPALRAARHGVTWNALALGYLDEAAALLRQHSPANPYTANGRPKAGDIRCLPGLGRLLKLFAQARGELFHGDEGARLVEAVSSRGGFLTREDLRQSALRHTTLDAQPLGGGATLRVTPDPTQGPLLAEAVARAGEGAALCDAVFEVRGAAKARGRLARDAGTSVVTAADEAGNLAVVLHSNSFPQFASGIVLDDGLVLNNRPGRGFDLEAPVGAPNAPAPGVVPPTTLHAWMYERDDALFAGATPGGVNQLPWNAQTLADLRAGRPLAEVVTAPRWAVDRVGNLRAEEGADTGGRSFQRIPALSLRSAQQIVHVQPGALHVAAADPRAGAVALPVH